MFVDDPRLPAKPTSPRATIDRFVLASGLPSRSVTNVSMTITAALPLSQILANRVTDRPTRSPAVGLALLPPRRHAVPCSARCRYLPRCRRRQHLRQARGLPARRPHPRRERRRPTRPRDRQPEPGRRRQGSAAATASPGTPSSAHGGLGDRYFHSDEAKAMISARGSTSISAPTSPSGRSSRSSSPSPTSTTGCRCRRRPASHPRRGSALGRRRDSRRFA